MSSMVVRYSLSNHQPPIAANTASKLRISAVCDAGAERILTTCNEKPIPDAKTPTNNNDKAAPLTACQSQASKTVPYTQLTLPTNYSVYNPMVAVA